MSIRIGLGYDLHRLEEGDYFLLAGVKIVSSLKIIAHSDGDIVYHSLADALYSSIGEKDIGEHFSDKDESTLGMDSSLIVKDAYYRVKSEGYSISNVNIIIILEEPKLTPYKEKIKENVADILQVSKKDISISAKSREKREKDVISCLVQVLIERR